MAKKYYNAVFIKTGTDWAQTYRVKGGGVF